MHCTDKAMGCWPSGQSTLCSPGRLVLRSSLSLHVCSAPPLLLVAHGPSAAWQPSCHASHRQTRYGVSTPSPTHEARWLSPFLRVRAARDTPWERHHGPVLTVHELGVLLLQFPHNVHHHGQEGLVSRVTLGGKIQVVYPPETGHTEHQDICFNQSHQIKHAPEWGTGTTQGLRRSELRGEDRQPAPRDTRVLNNETTDNGQILLSTKCITF